MTYSVDVPVADLAARLRAFEECLDAAYEAGCELGAALPRARRQARLSAVVGQNVFDSIIQATAAVSQARGHAVQGHRLLDKVGQALGVEYAYGDEFPKPEFTGAAARQPLEHA